MHPWTPNLLSFLRIPLAFFFLSASPWIRLGAILAAAGTDFLDGFFARKYNLQSKIGLFLDPIADKFFTLFALAAFFFEKTLDPWQIGCLLSRDFSLIAFGMLKTFLGKRKEISVAPFLSGKMMTALQFAVFLGISCQITFSFLTYLALACVGLLAFLELLSPSKQVS